MKKIVLIGPESTGKTTLTQDLAAYYQCNFVPEMARNYIENLDRPYTEEDLLKIAQLQIQKEDSLSCSTQPFLFCDTDLIVIKVWSEDKYSRCHPWILEQINQRYYDFYLLCGIDVNWEYDPQREDPERREELYRIYLDTLRYYEKDFLEIKGCRKERLQIVTDLINKKQAFPQATVK